MTLPRERQEARKTSLSCRDRIRGQMPRVATTSLVGQSVDQEVLAKCLNMTSTAEGVEMLQQMEVLQAIGCTEMQSYPFSHARPRAKSDNSSRKIPGGKPEPPDTNTTRRLPAPRKPDGFFCLPGPGPQKIQPASKKNPYRLQGRSGATSYLHGFGIHFCRCAWCFNERPSYEDRRRLPRYRHHRVGICIVVLEMAPNQGAGRFAGRDF